MRQIDSRSFAFIRGQFRRSSCRLFAGLLVCLTLPAAEVPRIVYSKSFPGSSPAFVEIRIDKAGECEYREAPGEEPPLKFRLNPNQTGEIFALADKLDRFKRPLEANLKVAMMGIKTFRFEEGATHSEVKFNFSLDADARTLADWFERMVESEQHFISLERTARFDKLGVYRVILNLETSWDRKRLVGPEQFLPLLDRVAKNESYVHMARERAAALADAFRGLKADPE
ncbi:MAG: hypothetical protein HY822_00370 [Acidobacteria bacterium]|nr:hypothetical protein [Acidobacteriota bacterium]